MVLLVDLGNERVADQAGDEEAGHDVHGDRIGFGLGRAVIDLVFADVVYEDGAQNGGGGPGGEQAPVDGADVHGAEEVAQVRGNGREAAAVHAEDDAEAGD